MVIHKDSILNELQQRSNGFKVAAIHANTPENKKLFAVKEREAKKEYNARIKELYFSLDPFEEPTIEGKSKEELQDEFNHLQLLVGAISSTVSEDEKLDEEQDCNRIARLRSIRIYENKLRLAIDDYLAKEYSPSGPDEAPYFEPSGFYARAGFVKSNPGNNDFYIEQFKDHPWYPAIQSTHHKLEDLIPGYNVQQVKEKFGRLCYYFEYPNTINDLPGLSKDAIKTRANTAVQKAEAWVEGYEYAVKQLQSNLQSNKD